MLGQEPENVTIDGIEYTVIRPADLREQTPEIIRVKCIRCETGFMTAFNSDGNLPNFCNECAKILPDFKNATTYKINQPPSPADD